MLDDAEIDTRLSLAPDPNETSQQCWRGTMPPDVVWTSFEDRLVSLGLFPKQAVQRLRVYGTNEGHEVLIELASRELLVRLHPSTAESERPRAARAVGALLLRALPDAV